MTLVGYDISSVYLFGSFARGEERADSDIDIRIECGPGISYGDLHDIQQKLEELLGRNVEMVANPLKYMRPAFRDRILKDQVLLYEAA